MRWKSKSWPQELPRKSCGAVARAAASRTIRGPEKRLQRAGTPGLMAETWDTRNPARCVYSAIGLFYRNIPLSVRSNCAKGGVRGSWQQMQCVLGLGGYG